MFPKSSLIENILRDFLDLEGPERHLNAASKNCRETILAAQLNYNCPHRGGNFERGRKALSCGGEAIWEAFKETVWVRVVASQNLPRDSGESIFCCEALKMSRRALWGRFPKFSEIFPQLAPRKCRKQPQPSPRVFWKVATTFSVALQVLEGMCTQSQRRVYVSQCVCVCALPPARKDCMHCNPPTRYRSLWALRARNPQKVSEIVSLGLLTRGPKSVRNSLKTVS